MRFYKKPVTILIAIITVFWSSACGIFDFFDNSPSPDPQPHFISQSERESEAYIPLVESANDDARLYVSFTPFKTETQQLDELFSIIAIDKKIPIIQEGDSAVYQKTRDLWNALVGVFKDYTLSTFSDYEYAHTFHDWLVYFVDYDFDAYNSYLENPTATPTNMMLFNAYGAIVNKKAVCDGLSKAFSVLCALAEVDCIKVSGEMPSDDGKMIPHAWNKVKLEDKWYNVDTTADACYISVDGKLKKYLTHGFMFISDEAISEERIGRHIFGEQETPAATENYPYYDKNFLFSVGSKNYYSKISTLESLYEAFDYIKSQKRAIGKLELKFTFASSTNYRSELTVAYKNIKNSDYKVSDEDNAPNPWIEMPNNTFFLIIYK